MQQRTEPVKLVVAFDPAPVTTGGWKMEQGRHGWYAAAMRAASSNWFAWSTAVLLAGFLSADWVHSLWEIPLAIVGTCCLIMAFYARMPSEPCLSRLPFSHCQIRTLPPPKMVVGQFESYSRSMSIP